MSSFARSLLKRGWGGLVLAPLCRLLHLSDPWASDLHTKQTCWKLHCCRLQVPCWNAKHGRCELNPALFPCVEVPVLIGAVSSSSNVPLVDWYNNVSSSKLLPGVLNRPENRRLLKASPIAFIIGFNAGSSVANLTTFCRKSKSSPCCRRRSFSSWYFSRFTCSIIFNAGALIPNGYTP